MVRNPNILDRIQFLKEKLKGPKPGFPAQMKMVTQPRPGNRLYNEVEFSSLKAGVLILLYPVNDSLYLVLTQRTNQVEFHKGQISFPGGKQESNESPEQSALREAQEELGIKPDSIWILGRLTPIYIPPSNYCMYPVVAAADRRPEFRPFPLEVAEVLEIPLDHFLDPENVRRETWPLRGIDVEVPFYSFKDKKIWGATAMVLSELSELIKEGDKPK
jgi:8-oxo-dGTP pyrophosphatase MutT (NUDIX family)